MNLREFVGEALTSIAEGVRDAQKRGKELGLSVNPIAGVFFDPEKGERGKGQSPVGVKVHFDVAVVATKDEKAGGKAGLSIWGVGAAGELATSEACSHTSRIAFDVPVMLPRGYNWSAIGE
jgi:hypothetical protein